MTIELWDKAFLLAKDAAIKEKKILTQLHTQRQDRV